MLKKYLFGVLLLGLWACTSNQASDVPRLRVAAAASTQPVLKALEDAFQKEQLATTGQAVTFENYVQASGKLVAQIVQGAQLDVFLSADSLYPAYLATEGRTAVPPITYARGSLVLWSAQEELVLPQNLQQLELTPQQRLTLADPKAAPYGRLAQRALKEAGILEKWPTQLVYAQNIEQVNLYLDTQVADLGLTAKSSLAHPILKDKGQYLLLPAYQLPQAMALLQPLEGAPKPEARAFYDFLQSKEAQAILMAYGYDLP